MEEWESDSIIEKWIQEHDNTFMPLPSFESEPHLLVSKVGFERILDRNDKVRKHYMEYLIKLLSVNYENNQKLLNKNIYLPSAIWRCAKMIEMSAVQASMVVHLYRKSITDVINELKKSTSKGSLYKKLYECLHYAPENEKKVQATLSRSKDCNCPCSCNQRKKVKRVSESPTEMIKNIGFPNNNTILAPILNNIMIQPQTDTSMAKHNNFSPMPNIRTSIDCDELTQQLDKLFQGEANDDDDLFDSALCMTGNSKISDESTMLSNKESQQVNMLIQQENQEPQKGLEERLALLSGILVNNTETSTHLENTSTIKKSNPRPTKWICEEYFQKVKLYELLDQIRDSDRNKFTRVKEKLLDLFGDDSDDDGVISPLDENPDFVASCKERIAPWVVKILTPYYVKGRIRGKNLFKSLAKHLIRLIYQCSKYPQEYEVQSFVKDFLDTHKMIRCEADFKQFRIENFQCI